MANTRRLYLLLIVLVVSLLVPQLLPKLLDQYKTEILYESQTAQTELGKNLKGHQVKKAQLLLDSISNQGSSVPYYFTILDENQNALQWYLPKDSNSSSSNNIHRQHVPKSSLGAKELRLTDGYLITYDKIDNYWSIRAYQVARILSRLTTLLCILFLFNWMRGRDIKILYRGGSFLGLVLLFGTLFYLQWINGLWTYLFISVLALGLGLETLNARKTILERIPTHPRIYLLYFIGTIIFIGYIHLLSRLFSVQDTLIPLLDFKILVVPILWRAMVSILIGAAITMVLYRIVKETRLDTVTSPQRLWLLLAAVLSAYPIHHLFYLDINGAIYISLCLISFLLIDVFHDKSRLNFTWLLSWICAIAGISSVMVSNSVPQKATEIITQKFDQTFLDHENTREDLLHITNSDSILAQGIRPPYPFSVDVRPLERRLDSLLKSSNELTTFGNSKIYLIDSRGQFISTPVWPLNPAALQSLTRNTTQYISPLGILNVHFMESIIIENHPYNPINLHLVLPSNQIIPFSDQIQFAPTVGDIPLYLNNPDFILSQNFIETLSDTDKTKTNLQVPRIGLTKTLSLFSLHMFLGFIILISIPWLNRYLPLLPRTITKLIFNKRTIRYRIQTTMLSSIIFSFLIIAVLTLLFLKDTLQSTDPEGWNRFNQTILEKLSSAQIQEKSDIELTIKQLGLEGSVDISQFKNGQSLISPNDFIPYQLYEEIQKNRKGLVQKPYTSYISTSRSPGVTYEVSLQEKSIKSKSILTRFGSTLMNAFMFLFLFAASLAIGLSNSISKPIDTLAQNLRQLKLGAAQSPISTENKDELGDLIDDYNSTVRKLEDSARLIAITERESAFREMAKQIAHEIKNPLTPMKLNIQHLEYMSKQMDPEQLKEMVQKATHTLLEQIDSLAAIATEFSSFAKFPQPENQKIILNEVIATAHDLFRKRDDIEINLYVPIDDIYVFADKSFLLRVFNNLLKNSIQAIPKGRFGLIDIHLKSQQDKALISIRDNGSGIDPAMQEKVFLPNFTTKSSGTGLGLAISTNIIESIGGRIYFETVVNRGTTFYVELPIIRENIG